MKQALPLLLFLFLAVAVSAQTSFSDRLSIAMLDNDEKVELKVFPNPATQYIGVTKNNVVKQIAVYNLVGRQMKSFRADAGERHYIGDLPRGMYLIQLIGTDDKILKTQRVNKR